VDPVLAALRRAVESELLPRGGSILLAVSGGPDSMALFHGCRELADALEWTLTVGHVHHGLRGREADRDLAFVRDHCRRLGLTFLLRRVDAAGHARALGLSPEAAARHVRYAALAGMARACRADRIAVAHQADDVAETCALARERRGGTFALAGPRERRDDGVVRPLLAVTRAQIFAFLAARGAGFRRDASNGDLRLARNRVRRELAAEGPDAARRLARAAVSHARRRDAIEQEVRERVLPGIRRGPGATLADAAALARGDREVARRALLEAAAPYARPGRPPLTGRERERILDRLAGGGDFRFEAGRRIRFERRGAVLTVSPRPGAASSAPAKV
jgi:tRNA(Ile)-lysidine synthase